ncbi:MAG: PilZ domain-containing protein [Candidatus Omnitrophica bacterium]|nr:PilZ domain-containing protein [Candidatus Omnitrophota bacterium]
MKKMKEKRKFIRTKWKYPVVIFGPNNEILNGQISNISLTGAYITRVFPCILRVGDIFSFNIILSDIDLDLRIEGDAIVLRQESTIGIGVKFTKFNADALMHLRKIVTYNHEDTESTPGKPKIFSDN